MFRTIVRDEFLCFPADCARYLELRNKSGEERNKNHSIVKTNVLWMKKKKKKKKTKKKKKMKKKINE